MEGIGRKSISKYAGIYSKLLLSQFVWIYYFALKNKLGWFMIGIHVG